VQPLAIPRKILEEMIQAARTAAPHECCGLLAGQGRQVTRHYEIANIVATEGAEMANFDVAKISHLQRLSPDERADIAFVMDAREMSLAFKDMRANALELQVIYHSHPHSPSRPSLTDITNATDFESVRQVLHLAEPLHLIVSLENRSAPVLNAFRIAGGQVSLVSYTIT
jgi:[CysO sulfur-carrier protein]-S-L-cysteine hydrolase